MILYNFLSPDLQWHLVSEHKTDGSLDVLMQATAPTSKDRLLEVDGMGEERFLPCPGNVPQSAVRLSSGLAKARPAHQGS